MMAVSDSSVSGVLLAALRCPNQKVCYIFTPKHFGNWTSRESDGDLSSMFCSELQTDDSNDEE